MIISSATVILHPRSHRPVLSFFSIGVALAASLVGCSGGAGDDGASASAGEEALRGSAHAPIPQVLQYVGGYTGQGSFSALELRRDGTFVATIAGARETGRFEGPKAPSKALKIVFIARGDSFTATIPDGWTEKQSLIVTRRGASETLTSPWPAGTETMCDDTQGHWSDDDVDPATGLFCVCDAPRSYIPSQGGCVL